MFDLDSIPTGDLSDRQVTSMRAVLPRFGSSTGLLQWDDCADAIRFAHNLDEATNVNQMVIDEVFAWAKQVNAERAQRNAETDALAATDAQIEFLGTLLAIFGDAQVDVEDLWDRAEAVETRAEFRQVLGKIRLRAARFGVDISREANAEAVETASEVTKAASNTLQEV